MQKTSEYRSHAQSCRDLAAKIADLTQRDMLLSMAATWDQLADQRERVFYPEAAGHRQGKPAKPN